jgi:hypothetical protein
MYNKCEKSDCKITKRGWSHTRLLNKKPGLTHDAMLPVEYGDGSTISLPPEILMSFMLIIIINNIMICSAF